MINIEDFIVKNHSELDSEELSPGHEFNFDRKLKKRFHSSDLYLVRYSIAIAASIMIFVASGIYVYKTKSEGYKGAVKTSEWVEFVEAEQYYSQQSEKAFAQLKQTMATQPQDMSAPVLKEMKEMENSYSQLKKDLSNNPNDIRLMSAVVQYHQLRLEVINNLIERFTLYSNNKINSHEKSNI